LLSDLAVDARCLAAASRLPRKPLVAEWRSLPTCFGLPDSRSGIGREAGMHHRFHEMIHAGLLKTSQLHDESGSAIIR